MNHGMIGYAEALEKTLSHIRPLAARTLPFSECTDHVSGEDLRARVDAPSVDAALRDGYAVRSEDVAGASAETPVALRILDTAGAGAPSAARVLPGTAIRVMTGAKIPEGADAVVSEEYTQRNADGIVVLRNAESGRNILPKGTDIRKGEIILRSGDLLTPGIIGLVVASGFATVSVVPKPRVAILATGDEVVYPGAEFSEGKLFASNMATLHAWLSRLNMETRMETSTDDERTISEKIVRAARENDAVLTSGGAWKGDRDRVVRTLEALGWRKIFHRVRMRPGKGAGFGFLDETPVFVLPGGPSSNLAAFLFLALPSLMKMAGSREQMLRSQPVRLKAPLQEKKGWTRFVFGKLERKDGLYFFIHSKNASRLRSLAEAQCVITLPEGMDPVSEGAEVMGTMLV